MKHGFPCLIIFNETHTIATHQRQYRVYCLVRSPDSVLTHDITHFPTSITLTLVSLLLFLFQFDLHKYQYMEDQHQSIHGILHFHLVGTISHVLTATTFLTFDMDFPNSLRDITEVCIHGLPGDEGCPSFYENSVSSLQ